MPVMNGFDVCRGCAKRRSGRRQSSSQRVEINAAELRTRGRLCAGRRETSPGEPARRWDPRGYVRQRKTFSQRSVARHLRMSSSGPFRKE